MTDTITSNKPSDYQAYSYTPIRGPKGSSRRIQLFKLRKQIDEDTGMEYWPFEVSEQYATLTFDQPTEQALHNVQSNVVCSLSLCAESVEGEFEVSRQHFVTKVDATTDISIPEKDGYTRLIDKVTFTPILAIERDYEEGKLVEVNQSIENKLTVVSNAYRKHVTTTVHLKCSNTIVSTFEIQGEHGVSQTIDVPVVEGFTTTQQTLSFTPLYDPNAISEVVFEGIYVAQ